MRTHVTLHTEPRPRSVSTTSAIKWHCTSQTRSIGYVADLVEGVWRLLESDVADPVNIGNPEEITVLDLARAVAAAVGVDPDIRFVDRPVDDPTVRRPDITRARELLGWDPAVTLQVGLERTVGLWGLPPKAKKDAK